MAFVLNDAAATEALGAAPTELLRPGAVLAPFRELGAGAAARARAP